MSFYTFTQTLWERFSWIGKKDRFGESAAPQELSTIENKVAGERSIDTTVDCYVTGQYIDSAGKLFSIKQRYSIRIIYSTSTMHEVMAELRARLVSEFELKYSQFGFNVTDVFIPEMVTLSPVMPEEEYRGRRLWKLMTRIERKSYGEEMRTAREVFRGRRMGLIRRYKVRGT